MPDALETAFVVLHSLAAAVWVGGTVALVFIAVPVARRLTGEERAAALRGMGDRWRPIGWGSLGLLVATGLPLAAENDAFDLDRLTGSGFGGVFLAKVAAVACLAAVAYAHDFVLGPRLARQIREGRPQAARPRLVAVGWVSFALTLGVPVLGVLLREIG